MSGLFWLIVKEIVGIYDSDNQFNSTKKQAETKLGQDQPGWAK